MIAGGTLCDVIRGPFARNRAFVVRTGHDKVDVAIGGYGIVRVAEADLKPVLTPSRALEDVLAEQQRAHAVYGGPAHNDLIPLATAANADRKGWVQLLSAYLEKVWRERPAGPDAGEGKGTRARLVQLAGLALSAIESIDRAGIVTDPEVEEAYRARDEYLARQQELRRQEEAGFRAMAQAEAQEENTGGAGI